MLSFKRKEKSVDEILRTINKEKYVTQKTLVEFSQQFQPDIQRVKEVLKSSKTNEHIKVSENMFQLVKNKWRNVINQTTTLQTLFDDEHKRFIVLVSEQINNLKMEQRNKKVLLLNN
jgi:hypothetical protein